MPEATSNVHHEEVMGTVVTFDVRTPAPRAKVDAALACVTNWLHWVDDTFSTYKPNSEVSRFDRGELPIDECSAELKEVVALCYKFNGATSGFFDAWASGRFDPSGVVKGWSVERASRLLQDAGLGDHSIDGGGDVRLSGAPGAGRPWHIGVRHPLRRDAYCAALALTGGAVATSGTYERGPHVLSPFSRQPATELISVTIVGPELVSADAYATAAFAMGARAADWLEGLAGYESLVISPDGRGWSTQGFKDLQSALPVTTPG
ncbi:MAG: FAD:protein FMN transferase [Acidimicrobiales bacterium]